MAAWFLAVLGVLITMELVKGLSANGTPPILQKYSWQLDLAWIMWNSIVYIRMVCFAALGFLLWAMYPDIPNSVRLNGPVLFAIWFAVMWIFNFFWVGKHKFHEIAEPRFVTPDENEVDLDMDIMGTAHNGEAKAYPVPVMAWHHRLQDEIGGQPIWVTYCAMCMSGRIYNRTLDGKALDFSLIGAITYNATFKDKQTGSWWRQEMGDAVKGQRKGAQLQDMFLEHMTLGEWLQKFPESKVLQYDAGFEGRYSRVRPILEGRAWFPKWQMHKNLQRIAGIDLGDHARAYDRALIKERGVINDNLGGCALAIFSSEDGRTTLAYERTLNGRTLEFTPESGRFRDTATNSTWNLFGVCSDGELRGAVLDPIQVRQQNIRSWTTFHPQTSIYEG